jgi:hypothetical protein
MGVLSYNDFGVSNTSYTLPDISSPDIWNGWNARVGYFYQTGNVTVTCSGIDTLSGDNIISGSTTVRIYRPYSVLYFEADKARNEWVVSGGSNEYVEFWELTTQGPMTGAISFDYVQSTSAQSATSVLFTTSTGSTLEFVNTQVRYSLSLQLTIDYSIATNNSDVIVSIDPVYAGTGFNILPDLADSFTFPRTGSFNKSYKLDGFVIPDLTAQTISFNASSSGTSGSAAAILDATLVVRA